MASYRWYVGDLRTGKIAREIDLIDYSWSAPFDDAGSLAGSFPLASGEWPTARSDTAAAKQFLAVAFEDTDGIERFLNGGPIWTTKYDDATAKLTIGAAGLGSYFDHRKVMAVLVAGQNPAESTVTYTGAQLSLIAKRLIELAQSHTGGDLPIVLPSDAELGGAGTKHTRTYPGYELGTVGDRVKQLTEVKGGPEIQFVPRRRGDDPRFIEWVMRVGTDSNSMMLTQQGPAWVFDRTVPKSPIASISVDSDGSAMATRAWAAGQGEGEGRPIVYANDPTLTNAGWPLLETEQSSTDTITEDTTLADYTAELLAASARPIETWAMSVDINGRPNLGQYATGDWMTVRVKSHPFLPEGDYSMRALNLSGDTSNFVTVNLSPRLGVL